MPTLRGLDYILEVLKDNNLQYFVDYDYDRTGCTGHCSDYCRCTQIINTRINSVGFNYYVDQIEDVFLRYAVDRTLRHSGLNDLSKYKVETGGGYYGEEVYGVRFNGDLGSIIGSLKDLQGKDHNNLIETALIAEYGYLLPTVENKDWQIKTIKKEQLAFGNENYYEKRLNSSIVQGYKDYSMPRGIVIPLTGGTSNDKYRVIDGHHRLAAGKDTVEVFIGE